MAATGQYLIKPVQPTSLAGRSVLEYPPTDTLVLFFVMDGLFILPEFIDIERWNDSLAKALALFPPVAGRLRTSPSNAGKKGGVYLQLTNSGIPVSVVDDYETTEFPLDSVVVPPESAAPWMDPIPVLQVLDQDEPLVRFRFTRLHKTGEMVYAISWLHALGDGNTVHLFLSHIANFYRKSGDYLPVPNFQKVFFDPPPTDPAVAAKFHPLMKHLRDAKPMEEVAMAMMESQQRTSEINLRFSPRQLELLRTIAMEGATDRSQAKLSKIDILVSYLVYVYNHLQSRNNSGATPINTIVNVIDYRGNPAFAPAFMFGNAAITLTCPSFFPIPPLGAHAGPRDKRRHLSQYLWNVSQSIRAGYKQVSDPQFLAQYLEFHNDLCAKAYEAERFQDLSHGDRGEITFNSAHVLNWRKAADFFPAGSPYSQGRRNRFHSSVLFEKYIRIFSANPIRKNGLGGLEWDDSLEGGAETAFCLDRSIAEEFKRTVARDMMTDFSEPQHRL
ncbi:hypothetical protein C8R44DRAFT_785106 [Mycena epipterygia]|nr:hypothetical protein C8R44DRAFT_785106 [Mycena epipterygia]